MQTNYEILGVSENATEEEIELSYQTLKSKYSKDRFLEGEAGNEAAKNLTKLEEAYNEIKSMHSSKNEGTTNGTDFSEVREFLREGKYTEAQNVLDNYTERNAEWHYFQSVIFYKKNWINESKKQLEIAIEMDPNNQKYSDEYNKLKDVMNFHDKSFKENKANYSGTQNVPPEQNGEQMGGDSCLGCLDCCATWCCINACCNSCCR